MCVLILFNVSLGWVGGTKILSFIVLALFVTSPSFALLSVARSVLLVLLFLLVLLLLHCLCLGSRRFRLPSFACSLSSSPVVFSPLANRCPSSLEVFFALLAPILFLSPLASSRGAYGNRLPPNSIVCSNPSLKSEDDFPLSTFYKNQATEFMFLFLFSPP